MTNKTILLLVLSTLVVQQAWSQSPSAIPYQAMARDNAGNPAINRYVALRISILQATASGTFLYSKTHLATTNNQGLFSLNIGTGTAISGTFASIDWGNGAKFTKIEVDLNGGSSHVTMGTQQLMSVPDALYSSNGWNKTGNSGTIPSYNYIGTSDANDVAFRTNGAEKMRIIINGNVGIGSSSAQEKLHVEGKIRMVDGNQVKELLLVWGI
jgi:hypothetical protein